MPEENVHRGNYRRTRMQRIFPYEHNGITEMRVEVYYPKDKVFKRRNSYKYVIKHVEITQ